MIAARARPLVRAALAKRLAELGPVEPAAALERSPHPEETLRVVMVKHYPKLAKYDAAQRAAAFALLLQLAEAALGEDIRFLDAWNAVYEATPAAARSEPAFEPVRRAYARLLQAAITRLS